MNWYALRLAFLGLCVICAIVDVVLQMYGWAAYMFGCAILQVLSLPSKDED